MQTILLIALCGALGCLTRYFLSGWTYKLIGGGFPSGTLAVNIAGAFCIGLIMEFSMRSTLISPSLRIALTIGFLGGLTTFSTFSYETFRLPEGGRVVHCNHQCLPERGGVPGMHLVGDRGGEIAVGDVTVDTLVKSLNREDAKTQRIT